MRRIKEIGEHSVWTLGLVAGSCVVDAGANHGRFSMELVRQFQVETVAVEANPCLAAVLRNSKLRIVECALGAANATTTFHLGENDEASSLRKPKAVQAHLK